MNKNDYTLGSSMAYLVSTEAMAVAKSHSLAAFATHRVQAVVRAVVFNLAKK